MQLWTGPCQTPCSYNLHNLHSTHIRPHEYVSQILSNVQWTSTDRDAVSYDNSFVSPLMTDDLKVKRTLVFHFKTLNMPVKLRVENSYLHPTFRVDVWGYHCKAESQQRGLLCDMTFCPPLAEIIPAKSKFCLEVQKRAFYHLITHRSFWGKVRSVLKFKREACYRPGGACSRGGWYPSMDWGRPPPGETATAADGTHPTGIHSCSRFLPLRGTWLHIAEIQA